MAAVLVLAPATQAIAHTNSIGYESAGPGAITFWYGSWHDDVPFTEGSFQLQGVDVAYDETVSFSLLSNDKPAGLIDGETNFFSNGSSLTGTPSGGTYTWQGVSFTGLSAGTYTFTYIPIASPTAEWEPADSIILSSTVSLSAELIGEPEVGTIDTSKETFTQEDAEAAAGRPLVFDGGTLAPSQSMTFDQSATLNADGGTVDSSNGDLAFTGPIEGDGALTKKGAGTVTLTGANAYRGGTTIQGGTLVGNSQSLQGQIVNNANLVFEQANDGVFTGTISGAGTLNKNGGGVLTLTGAHTYTGGTSIQGGTLAGNTQSLQGPIVNNANLVFNQASNGAFTGTISGTGTLNKNGAGVLTLTGAHSYTGPTFANQGVLVINGQVGSSPVNILSGARLGGTGRIGGLTVQSGGAVTPGNSIGTLQVAGPVTFQAGSVLQIEANAAGQSDVIAATGPATLQGGTVQVLAEAGAYQPVTTYKILTASSVGGQFAGATSNLAFLTPLLSYESAAVVLRLVRNDLSFATAAATANQAAAAGAIDDAFTAANPVYMAFALASAAEQRAGLDQFSGEAHASAAGAAIEAGRLVEGGVAERLRGGAAGRNVWAQAFGGWGETDATGNTAGVDRDTSGFLIGGELPVGETFRFGLAAGQADTDFDLQGRPDSGDIEATHVWAYAGAELGQVRLSAGLGYADLSFDVQRRAAVGSFADALNSSYGGSAVMAFAQAGYRTALAGVAVEPFVGVSRTDLETDGIRETGGAAALAGAAQDHDASFATIGVRGSTALGSDSPLKLNGTLAWREALSGEAPSTAVALQAGGGTFRVAGAPVADGAVVVGAGLDWQVGERLKAEATYSGEFSDEATGQAFRATLTLSF